jgi:hypothetical protein
LYHTYYTCIHKQTVNCGCNKKGGRGIHQTFFVAINFKKKIEFFCIVFDGLEYVCHKNLSRVYLTPNNFTKFSEKSNGWDPGSGKNWDSGPGLTKPRTLEP